MTIILPKVLASWLCLNKKINYYSYPGTHQYLEESEDEYIL